MRFRLSIFFSLVLCLSSCSSKSVRWLEKKNIHVEQARRIIGSGTQTIQIQYLGCGGLFIRKDSQAIMIDPFFSHHGFNKIGRAIILGSKLKPKTAQLAYGYRMINDSLQLKGQMHSEVKAIFSAHGHYDHLMDVPFIYEKWLKKSPVVYANSSSVMTCSNVIDKAHLFDVEKSASVRNQVGTSVDFNSNSASTIRVYPIFANHNPHSRHIKLFAGSVIEPPKNYNEVDDKSKLDQWLEGQTLSFLVDFLHDGKVSYRIFVQSSSCNFPDGLPPQSLLNGRQVDLAILGAASYHYSENTYPCKYIEAMKPAHVMFIHWEDFFRKYQSKVKTVRKNDIPRFFSQVAPRCTSEFLIPVPGFVLEVKY